MTISQSNITILDGNGNVQLVRSDENSVDGSIAFRHIVEIGGSDVAYGNPFPVIVSGSTGTDYSANAAAIPTSGYVLLSTVPASTTRFNVEVQNQSTSQIQLVLDDGAGNNQGSVILAAAATGNGQGGYWSSEFFKGRLRVYGPSSSQQVFVRAE